MTAAILLPFPAVAKRTTPEFRPCRHCGQRPGRKGRGLCGRCWAIVAVRQQYPAVPTHKTSEEADFNGTPPLPAEPTREMPGSEAKILVLMQRAELRLQLHHPGDAGLRLSMATRVFLGFVPDGSGGGGAGAEEEE